MNAVLAHVHACRDRLDRVPAILKPAPKAPTKSDAGMIVNERRPAEDPDARCREAHS